MLLFYFFTVFGIQAMHATVAGSLWAALFSSLQLNQLSCNDADGQTGQTTSSLPRCVRLAWVDEDESESE